MITLSFCPLSLILFILFWIDSSGKEARYGGLHGIEPLDYTQRLRILMVSIDSRELEDELTTKTKYPSLSAVLNYNYAKRHGYHYRYYHPFINIDEVEKKYNVKLNTTKINGQDPRSIVTSFHPGLLQYRGASWSKLPLLWHVATTMGNDYDLMIYLDSDLVITPDTAQGNRRVEDALKEWQEGHKFVWGVDNVKKSPLMFFKNSPYGDQEPCAGFFLFRPKIAAPMIKDWWDFDIEEKNFDAMHEQSGLWRLYNQEDQFKYYLNKSSITLIHENQFPVGDMKMEEWCLHKGWVCHVCNNWGDLRHIMFKKMLGIEEKEITSSATHEKIREAYRNAIKEIKEVGATQFNILSAAEAMEVSGDRNRADKPTYAKNNPAISSSSSKSSATQSIPSTIPPSNNQPSQSSEGTTTRKDGKNNITDVDVVLATTLAIARSNAHPNQAKVKDSMDKFLNGKINKDDFISDIHKYAFQVVE